MDRDNLPVCFAPDGEQVPREYVARAMNVLERATKEIPESWGISGKSVAIQRILEQQHISALTADVQRCTSKTETVKKEMPVKEEPES